jgi:hypothetical protein
MIRLEWIGLIVFTLIALGAAANCPNDTLQECIQTSTCQWCLTDNTCRFREDSTCSQILIIPIAPCHEAKYKTLFIIFVSLFGVGVLGACIAGLYTLCALSSLLKINF